MSLRRVMWAAFVCASLIFTAGATDWPNFRGPNYDGIAKDAKLKLDFRSGKPQIVWKARVNTGFSSIATSEGRVYTMGFKGGKDYVYCLDAKSGKEIWSQNYPAKLQPNLYEGGPNATPTVYKGLVFVMGKHGQVRCYDAKSGSPKWDANVTEEFGYKSPAWGFSGSPYISGDLVIFNAGKAGIAYDAKSGKVAWKSDKGKASYATPVPYKSGSKNAMLLFAVDGLKCMDPQSGKELWQMRWKTDHDVNSADPLVYGKNVFISSGYGRGGGLVEVSGASAKMAWENREVRNHFSSSVLIGDYVYGIDGNTNGGDTGLKCIRVKDGKVMWSERTGFGSLTAVNNKLIILRERGQLLSVDATPNGFKENGKVQVLGGKCWTSPIVSNGHLFARNAKGDLVCVKLK